MKARSRMVDAVYTGNTSYQVPNYKPLPWMGESNCKDMDPRLFEVINVEALESGEIDARRWVDDNYDHFKQASSACSTCPVGIECAEGASYSDRVWTYRNGKNTITYVGNRLKVLVNKYGVKADLSDMKKFCPNGHEYTPENTRPTEGHSGGAKCRRCFLANRKSKNRATKSPS